jgi:hypothetical protein
VQARAPRLIVRQRCERRDHVHSGRARRDHDAAAHRAKSCAYVNVTCRRVRGHARLRLGLTTWLFIDGDYLFDVFDDSFFRHEVCACWLSEPTR